MAFYWTAGEAAARAAHGRSLVSPRERANRAGRLRRVIGSAWRYRRAAGLMARQADEHEERARQLRQAGKAGQALDADRAARAFRQAATLADQLARQGGR